jgi:mitochondrial fission protein ELM1
LTKEGLSEPLRIWALLGARAGDNNQVLALCEAIGLPFEIKQLDYNGLRRLGPSLLGRSLASLTRQSRDLVFSGPPPDVSISAGHRSVPLVRALRQRSNNRTRSIHIGFPRVSPGHFDLVIATPQYPIPDHPNLLRVPFALTRAATAVPDPSDEPRLAKLPSPRRLLLVGGPNIYWKLDDRELLRTLAGMLDGAANAGGSVLVTTSARTPPLVRSAIEAELARSDVPSVFAAPRSPPSYSSLLAAADSIHVTADSVAMVSDAIWTGKPVATIPVATSWLGRLAIAIFAGIGRRLYPQDLRDFWTALDRIGISAQLALPQTSTEQVLRTIMERVRPILDR